MKIASFALLFTLMHTTLHSQYWARNTESEYVNEAFDIEIDPNGNSYITGYITGATAFDMNTSFPFAPGNGDIYVAKYSPSGALIWVNKFGGNYSDRGYDLALDQNNNILVTGQFFGTVNFGSVTLQAAGSSKDIFVLKLDASGNVIWAFSEGGLGAENAYGIEVDGANNVVLTGQFSGQSTIAGQNFTSWLDPLLGVPSNDLFISKYSSSGAPLWVLVGQAKYEDRGLAVQTDSQNNIILTGQFSDTLTFGGQQFNNNAYNVGLVTKISPSGQILFFNTLRASMVLPYDVEVNTLNEIVITGDFRGTMQHLDAGGLNIVNNAFDKRVFVLKTNTDGIYQWSSTLGSEHEVSARSVSIDGVKDIYVTGYFECEWSELQSQGSLFNSVGFKDTYLWKVNNNGSLTYVKQFGGKGDDQGHGVAIRGNIEPVLCGSYSEDLNIPLDFMTSYTIASNPFELLPISNEPSHGYLAGDESRNSFITDALGSYTPFYNYFYIQPTDSLYGMINFGQDTVEFCPGGLIWYNAQTYDHFGPAYAYLWNTGDTVSSISVSTSGTYDVNVERLDQCSLGYDSIYVLIHPYPALPLMTDNIGQAINQPGSDYGDYSFCYPDTLITWFTDLDSNLTFSVSLDGTVLTTDTLPMNYTQEGFYTVAVSNGFCASSGYFNLEYDYAPAYDIIPYLVLVDTIDYNDSITICEYEPVVVNLLDSLENPTGVFGLLPTDPVDQFTWLVSPNTMHYTVSDTFVLVFSPSVSGWYTITHSAAYGYDNLCGLDTTWITVSDSFYVEILPVPIFNVNITGPNLVCPGASVYLVVDTVVQGANWSGNSIVWTSPNGDSILVNGAGNYSYSGFYTSPLNGCSVPFTDVFLLNEIPVPIVQVNPDDAIICPNDSVLMFVPDVYLDYVWIGPMGDTLSTAYNHVDDDQGFYYVTVLDTSGCYLTSPPVELREYATPYLTVLPSNIICDNEQVAISAVFYGNGTPNWISPIVSNAPTITTNQPGWYVCAMDQCGITVMDSVEIIDGSFSANLVASDTLLCWGDEATISVGGSYSSYEWSNGEIGVSSIVVSTAGTYWVELMNPYGCEGVSDTVFIETVAGSQPPQIANQSLCAGSTLVLTNPVSTFQTQWYTVDSLFLGSGNSISIPGIGSDTVFLAAYPPTICPLLYDPIFITYVDSLAIFSILGDSILCLEEIGTYSVNVGTETLSWSLNGMPLGASNPIQLPASVLENNTLELVISNVCFSDSLQLNVQISPADTISLAADSLILCSYDDLQMSAGGSFQSVTWSGYFGQLNGQTLNLPSTVQEGYVVVSALGQNGCQALSDSTYITVSELVYSIWSDLGMGCETDLATVNVSTSTDSIIWTTPLGVSDSTTIEFVLNMASEGTWYLNLWNEDGCVYQDSLEITYNPLPILDLPDDTLICVDTYIGGAFMNSSYTLYWENGAADSMIVASAGWYTVAAMNQYGCITEDSIYVNVVQCGDPLPNVITPNGDGINDLFVIDEALLYPNNRLVIINRWGNEIYSQDGYENDFTGLGLSDGTYFYLFYYDRGNQEGRHYSGFLTLVH